MEMEAPFDGLLIKINEDISSFKFCSCVLLVSQPLLLHDSGSNHLEEHCTGGGFLLQTKKLRVEAFNQLYEGLLDSYSISVVS